MSLIQQFGLFIAKKFRKGVFKKLVEMGLAVRGKRKKGAKKKIDGQGRGRKGSAGVRVESKGESDVKNPFELKFNRQKHSILGRNGKGSSSIKAGIPGASKQKAQEKRKHSLLGEYRTLGKSNRFTDRRISEKNQLLTKKQKAADRFIRQRQNIFKKRSAYRLEDEGQTDLLTHLGQSVAEIETFDAPTANFDDSEAMDADFVSRVHFGGGIFDAEKAEKSSRTALIDSLIDQSKKLRYERQQEKSKQEDLTERLDEQWKELASENLLGKIFETGKRPIETAKNEDYDTLFHTLHFETTKRVKATEKLETPEEVAKREVARLKKLEKERLLRSNDAKGSTATKLLEHVSADDDISDNLDYSMKKSAANRTDAICYRDGKLLESGGIGIDAEEVDNGECRPSNLMLNVEDDYFNEIFDNEIEEGAKSELRNTNSAQLPYVFEMPASFSELVTLLRGHTTENQSLILDRLVKCHHPSLKEGNKRKLKQLFVFLLRYMDTEFAQVANCDFVHPTATALYKLTQLFPTYAAKSIGILLKRHRDSFRKQKCVFPKLNTVLLLRLVPSLFPSSDFRHPVVTPALIFAAELLSAVRIRCVRDAAKGLVLCVTMVEYLGQSKRYCPELINFLQGLMQSAVYEETPVCRKTLIVEKKCEKGVGTLSVSSVFGESETVECDALKLSCLRCCLALIQTLCKLYSDLPSFSEIFRPLIKLIERLPKENYPDTLASFVETVQIELSDLISKHRKKPLRTKTVEYEEFQFLEPRMEAGFNPERRKKTVGPKKGAKAERQRLVHKIKRETRGAIRELRKDSQFLARERLKETAERDEERTKKTKRILQSLRGQQADHNKLIKEKKQKR